jgi:hypothetical protein
MDFTDAIAIVIVSPFFLTMTNGGVGPKNVIVALPLIRIDRGTQAGEGVNVFFQGLLVGMLNPSQPNLATLASHGADNSWTIIIISAVTTLFIGPASRGIAPVAVIVTFFPPHAQRETFRPFQSGHRLKRFGVGDGRRWPEFLAGPRGPFGD